MKQSPNDHKHYQALTLANGLRVLLAQNTESDKAAAALTVNAGHFNDPKDRQGLAHFVEHMLFLGTEKFPDGSEYQKFISQHGGHNNAWTATEHTSFFFDVQHNYFEAALERFAQFFISPLLSESFVESERQNIDAEFKLKLKDDIRRLYDVHKETINPAHPFSQFSVGNIDTLADKPNKKVQQDIVNFFQRYYRAPYMTLALESPFPLSEMVRMVEHHFSEIKTTDQPLPAIDAPLYLPEQLQQEISVNPVKNDKQLIVSFALPSIDQYYRHKPESVLAYLIGHEGPGSILSYLKKQHWAMALTAGSGINGSNFKDFNISISLTEQGEDNIEAILAVVFSYIVLLKKEPLPLHYYQEKRSLAETAFQYLEKTKPLDAVSQLAINMQHYPLEDYIYGDYVMEGMCDDSISHLLQLLRADNCRIIRIGQKYQCNQKTHWYQVPYQQEPIAQSRLQAWQTIKPMAELFLPPKNEYIVDKPKTWPHSHETSLPTQIDSSSGLCIWFKQDTTFKVPKGYIYIGIDSPVAVSSHENIAMTRLFVDLYSSAIVEWHYDAELAGIHYHLYSHQGGMTLQLSGLSEKQPELLDKLLYSLKNQSFEQGQFELIKQQLLKHWLNADKNKSISQLFSTLSAFMQPNNPSSAELVTAMENIDFKSFKHFVSQLFTHVTIDVLIHGNWQEHHGHLIAEQIKETFHNNFDGRNHVHCPIVDLDDQQEIVLPVHLPHNDHAAVIYYPQPDNGVLSTTLAMLTSHLLAPIFFQEMRTDRQYGYLVNVGYIPINRYPGIAFYIQSPKTSPEELTQAINEFITRCSDEITHMPAEQWEIFKKGLTGQLKEKDTSLRIKSQRFWASICNQDYQFNRKEQLIKQVLNTELSDILDFINTKLSTNEQNTYQSRVTLVSSKITLDEFAQQTCLQGSVVTNPVDFTKNSQRKY